MRKGVSVAIDRRFEALIVAWARRQWPLLQLVPARWIRPAVRPTAARLRRSCARGMIALAVPGSIIFALLTYVR
jgi:hypothetical protein